MSLDAAEPRRPARWRVLAAGLAGLAILPAYAALLGDVPGMAQPFAALIGVFLAAYASAMVGFAFSALCAPILALAGLDALSLVQTLMICSIAIYGWSTFVLRRDLDFQALAPLLLGGLCALPCGVWLLLRLPEGSLHATVLGAMLFAYGAFALLRQPRPLRRPDRFGTELLIGATGGLTGALAAFPGAMIAIWCGLKPWRKERQRAVLQAYILVMQVAALGVIAALSEATGRTALPNGACFAYPLPAALGTVCGLEVFRFMTERQFGRSVNLLLVLSGIAMLLA
jgi:uncharacterized membrane protein YfcA